MVASGKMTLDEFWIGFFNYLTNGPSLVDAETRKLFGPIIDGGVCVCVCVCVYVYVSYICAY